MPCLHAELRSEVGEHRKEAGAHSIKHTATSRHPPDSDVALQRRELEHRQILVQIQHRELCELREEGCPAEHAYHPVRPPLGPWRPSSEPRSLCNCDL